VAPSGASRTQTDAPLTIAPITQLLHLALSGGILLSTTGKVPA